MIAPPPTFHVLQCCMLSMCEIVKHDLCARISGQSCMLATRPGDSTWRSGVTNQSLEQADLTLSSRPEQLGERLRDKSSNLKYGKTNMKTQS